jgi:hypothetical protein
MLLLRSISHTICELSEEGEYAMKLARYGRQDTSGSSLTGARGYQASWSAVLQSTVLPHVFDTLSDAEKKLACEATTS